MPWKVSSVMEERLRFVGRLLDGESMSDVCREFGISRKTGYKIYSPKIPGIAGVVQAHSPT
jgi:transposase-like protein